MPQLDAIRGKPLRRTLSAARPVNVDPCSILAEADTSVVTLQVDGSDTTLTRDAEACDRLRNVLSALGSDVTASADEDRPAVLLHDRLPDVEVVHRLDKIL